MESRQLTIDEVTASVMNVVGEATNEDRLLFKQWVAECAQNLGANSTWMKNCELLPKDGSFLKPKDLTATVDLALYAGTTEVRHKFIANSPGRIHVDRNQINATVSSTTTDYSVVDLSEDVYYFHLGNGGTQVTKMKISYLAIPVDREGFPLTPESNLDAYKMYCRWMWALRQNSNQSFINQSYDMWLRERERARGRNKMPDRFRANEFFKKYLSMVNAPIFNNG
jgi:hypothetical protein